MGKFRSCVVAFRQGKEVYRDGELVGGTVILDVLEDVVVKGVRVYCYGEALTKWSKEFTRDWNSYQIGKEKYFSWVVTVFGRKVNVDGPNQTLTAGKHRWNFAFRLPPERLPSSYEGEYGAIRWFLRVEVDKPFPSINNKWYRAFTVLSHLDTNEAVYKTPQKKTVSKTVSKALGLGNAGTLTLAATTDRFGYCPGEAIAVSVEAKNESTKDMGKVRVTLVQHVVFTANDETKTTDYGVSSMETENILAKGTTVTMSDLLLPIPAVPPSTRKRTCHIISCTYNVQVKVQVPWGLDLDTTLPVAIGTVPRGKKAPPPRQPAGQAVNPATVINYVKCETGVAVCNKTNDNFPNLTYVPYTAHVTNYVFNRGPNPVVGAAATPAPPPAQPTATGAAKAAEAGRPAPVVAPVVGPVNPPVYSVPSAPPAEEASLPPTYEDVLRMDEESKKETSKATTAAGAAAEPKGENCSLMLVRFPDSDTQSFRHSVQREQNNLMDSREAYLAALTPQPLTGLERPNDNWPASHALALLHFPDAAAGEAWLKAAVDRGDAWCSRCDAVLFPGSWTVPEDVDQRLVFSISTVKTRESATKQQIAALAKISPAFTKLRRDHGGQRQAVTKKHKMLRGQWLTDSHSIILMYWTHISGYFAYFLEIRKEAMAKRLEEFQAAFESMPLLLVSEDVSPLSTQVTLTVDEDCDEDEGEGAAENGDGDENEGEGVAENADGGGDAGEEEAKDQDGTAEGAGQGYGKAENSLVVNDEHFSSS